MRPKTLQTVPPIFRSGELPGPLPPLSSKTESPEPTPHRPGVRAHFSGGGGSAESSSRGLLVALRPHPRCPSAIPGQPAAASPTAPRSWAGQEAGTAAGWAGATWPGGCSLELARHLRAESGSRVSRPVTLSGSPAPPQLRRSSSLRSRPVSARPLSFSPPRSVLGAP